MNPYKEALESMILLAEAQRDTLIGMMETANVPVEKYASVKHFSDLKINAAKQALSQPDPVIDAAVEHYKEGLILEDNSDHPCVCKICEAVKAMQEEPQK